MRQAVKISFMGHCSPSATVPMAFHILLVRTAVYCHINMYSFLPEGVTVINALWGLAVTLDREARASCNRRGSPTLNWSLKDEGVGGRGGVWQQLIWQNLNAFYWPRVSRTVTMAGTHGPENLVKASWHFRGAKQDETSAFLKRPTVVQQVRRAV